MDEIKKVNQVSNSKAWSFRIKKLPDKKPDLSDDDQRIRRELRYANSGISLGSDVFSRSPPCEQEKTERPVLLGSNFVSFNQNFYTKVTTVYHSTTRKHKINKL